MNYLQLYKTAVTEILELFSPSNKEVNPSLSNRLMFTVRSYFIAYCYFASQIKKESDITFSLKDCISWIRKEISKDSPFIVVFERTDHRINDIVDRYVKQIDAESIASDLGFLYETLLHTDLSNSSVIDGDLSRNKQGSYYSPQELASYLTKTVIDNYIKTNSSANLYNARIVDFSCGSGVFLIESLRYIGKVLCLSDKDYNRFIRNIYACDVDFIALEICKFNIMNFVNDRKAYDILSANFRHANFLLNTSIETSQTDKIEAYLDGFIYHEDLAIGVDFLSEYDIILGNPPWEKIRFEEKAFYTQFDNLIGKVYFKSDLNDVTKTRDTTRDEMAAYCNQYKYQTSNAKSRIKKDLLFKASSKGELNTSNLFTEAASRLLSPKGTLGLIVKSSTIATTASKPLFEKISGNICVVVDFINRKKYFDIDGRERFSLLVMDRMAHEDFRLAMNIKDINEIEDNLVNVTKNDLLVLNPTTGMIPNIGSSKDLSILISIYKRCHTVSKEFPNLKYGRLVHFTNHSDDIEREKAVDNLPVYEGKFFSSFDGAYAGFNNMSNEDKYKSKAHAIKLSNKENQIVDYPESRFFIKTSKWNSLSASYHADYMLAWHSLTSATNSRACVATILPFLPASQSVQFLISDSVEVLSYLCCLFNSVVFDYIVKNKLTGIDLTQSFIKQIAVPSIKKAKAQLISYNGQQHNAFILLYSICKKLLMKDKRLTGFWINDVIAIPNLPSKRKDLFMLMDIVIAQLYEISCDQFEFIFKKATSYSEKEIESMMKSFNQ